MEVNKGTDLNEERMIDLMIEQDEIIEQVSNIREKLHKSLLPLFKQPPCRNPSLPVSFEKKKKLRLPPNKASKLLYLLLTITYFNAYKY